MESTGSILLCVGTSYRFVTVPVLERAMQEAEALRGAFLGETMRPTSSSPLRELALLITCNRVECYAACRPGDAHHAAALLKSAFQLEGDAQMYVFRDRDALRHLARVAAGLDSMIVGEPQIAGQVARAFAERVRLDGSRSLLQDAGALARRVSRRARTETGIARKPASISSVAVHVAAEHAGGLDDKHVLVIGAGKMGRLASEALRSSRARVTVANRTFAAAEQLARRVAATAVPLASLDHLVAAADVVITSTAAPAPLIDRAVVQRALDQRVRAGDLLLVDIAVPRNIDEDVVGVRGVQLIGIEQLHERVTTHLEERRQAIPHVEALIEEELSAQHARTTRTAHTLTPTQ